MLARGRLAARNMFLKLPNYLSHKYSPEEINCGQPRQMLLLRRDLLADMEFMGDSAACLGKHN